MMIRAVVAAVLALASPAVSATIEVSDYSSDGYAVVVAGFTSPVSEGFEGISEGNGPQGFTTGVGQFISLGGTGGGGSVTGADFVNDGGLLAVRGDEVYGRRNTTAGGARFLDSNDTFGIGWRVSLGGSFFDRIVLTLTDAADAGATLVISAGGASVSLSGLANGNQRIVSITFDTALDTALVTFTNYRNGAPALNDGFSIDDIAVSVVPLTQSVLFLLLALAGLAVLGRRHERSAATLAQNLVDQ